MNKNYFYAAAIALIATACGQTGKLYLTDVQRLRIHPNQADTDRLQKRVQKKQKLSAKAVKLLQQEQQLISSNQDLKKIHATRLERLEIEREIGQINLTQQLEGVTK